MKDARDMMVDTLEQAKVSPPILAREAGISYATLWSWTNGRRNPSAKSLAKLAGALERRGAALIALAAKILEVLEASGGL